jgi:AcrR family transcriptional regulator
MVIEPARRRRHGQELESALLTAAWTEPVEVGYARLTMDSIAKRAQTSEAVLYRRWANKDQLVLAALEHHRGTHPAAVLDMPFDLVRHDMRMDLKPLRPMRIRSIVDELFLPLVKSYLAQPRRNF